MGRNRLDTIVVSHADTDHSGGAAAVIDSYPRALVVAGPDVALTGASGCQAGQSWTWDGVEFSFLHPPADFTPLGNDSSCVLKVGTDAGTLIITGDIESFGERALLRGVPDLHADVVIVPHHGSATSSTPALVNSMNARYAVVSAAYSNQWDFPRPDVRARWEESGAEMVTTGDSGAITIVLGAAAEPRLTARRDRRRRYWHTKPSGVSG
jgi:competence protein ComEC